MTRRLLLFGLGLVVIAGCSSMSVHTDFDPTADFTAYKTYGWAPFAEDDVPGPSDKRLMTAVDEQMKAKGYKRVEEGGDLVLRYQSGVTLVLDMIDTAEKEIVWQGTARGAIDSYRPNPERLQEAVNRMLAQFPPS